MPKYDISNLLQKVRVEHPDVTIKTNQATPNFCLLGFNLAGGDVKVFVFIDNPYNPDIGFHQNPKLTSFIADNYQFIHRGWDPRSERALSIVVKQLKDALLDFYLQRIPKEIYQTILNGDNQPIEVFIDDPNENDSEKKKKLYVKLRTSLDEISLDRALKETDTSKKYILMWKLESLFEINLLESPHKPEKIRFIFYGPSMPKKEYLTRAVNNVPELMSRLSLFTKNATSMALQDLHSRQQRKRFLAGLKALFNRGLIALDKINFLYAIVISGQCNRKSGTNVPMTFKLELIHKMRNAFSTEMVYSVRITMLSPRRADHVFDFFPDSFTKLDPLEAAARTKAWMNAKFIDTTSEKRK